MIFLFVFPFIFLTNGIDAGFAAAGVGVHLSGASSVASKPMLGVQMNGSRGGKGAATGAVRNSVSFAQNAHIPRMEAAQPVDVRALKNNARYEAAYSAAYYEHNNGNILSSASNREQFLDLIAQYIALNRELPDMNLIGNFEAAVEGKFEPKFGKAMFSNLVAMYRHVNRAEPSQQLRNYFMGVAEENFELTFDQLVFLMFNLPDEALGQHMDNAEDIVRLAFGSSDAQHNFADEVAKQQKAEIESVDQVLKRMRGGEHNYEIEVESRSKVDTYDLFQLIYGFDLRAHLVAHRQRGVVTGHAKLRAGRLKNTGERFIRMAKGWFQRGEKGATNGTIDPLLKFKRNFERFAPDTWLFAYAAIPESGREALLVALSRMVGALSSQSAVDLDALYAELMGHECATQIYQFFAIVRNDFDQLSVFLEDNYVRLFRQIARNGTAGLKPALVHYLDVWENASPRDQANLARIWPKIDFFYNDKLSMLMNHWGLASARGNKLVLPPLLVLLKWVFLGAPSSQEVPNAEAYSAFEQALDQDYGKQNQLLDAFAKKLGPLGMVVPTQ